MAEVERNSDSINRKGGKLEIYTVFVVERLKMYQDILAQMHDLPKEHYPDFPAALSKIVYNYVMKIRKPAVSVSEQQYSCILDTVPSRYT